MTQQPLVRILMITDASGSMYRLRDDVIGGQNGYLDAFSAEDNIWITQVLFNTSVHHIDLDVPIAEARRLDADLYSPAGGTALLDAIGTTVRAFRANLSGDEGKVALYVNTDGHENSSREFTLPEINRLLTDLEAAGWLVIYSGAGPDAWSAGAAFANQGKFNTTHDAAGTHAVYDGYTAVTGQMLRGVNLNSSTATKVMEDTTKETGA